jgi:ssDNA-binding Zn-finger/Zn-ribbon topoisomerase 1
MKLCPDCGAAMVERENRKTQKPFWGCSRYPKCKCTQPIYLTDEYSAYDDELYLDMPGDPNDYGDN